MVSGDNAGARRPKGAEDAASRRKATAPAEAALVELLDPREWQFRHHAPTALRTTGAVTQPTYDRLEQVSHTDPDRRVHDSAREALRTK